jgi:hypothetical protein
MLSKDGASYMNAGATLSNGWTVKENGGGTVYTFFGPFKLYEGKK